MNTNLRIHSELVARTQDGELPMVIVKRTPAGFIGKCFISRLNDDGSVSTPSYNITEKDVVQVVRY